MSLLRREWSALKTGVGTVRYPRLEPKLKKRTFTNLYNKRPAWLELAHKKLDAAVARAYGWGKASSCQHSCLW